MRGMVRAWYFIIFLIVITLALYGNLIKTNKLPSSRDYLLNPSKYGGYEGEYFGKIINISEDYFYIRVPSTDLKVIGSGIKKPVLGESTFLLYFGRDGFIKLIDYHNYNYNYLLYLFSGFAFIIFLIIFFKEWRITKRGFKDA